MSFGVRRAKQFLDPLQGKAAVFLVPDRRTNLALSRLFVSSVAASGSPCSVLDMDAFYASNSELLVREIPQLEAANIRLHMPRIGASGEEAVMGLFESVERCIHIIDDLNSLYHTFSSEDQSSAGRKLTFLVEVLSFLGRSNGTTALITIYERERPTFARRARLFARLGDVSVSVRREDGSLVMHCERGTAWPGRALTLPISPSDWTAVSP